MAVSTAVAAYSEPSHLCWRTDTVMFMTVFRNVVERNYSTLKLPPGKRRQIMTFNIMTRLYGGSVASGKVNQFLSSANTEPARASVQN